MNFNVKALALPLFFIFLTFISYTEISNTNIETLKITDSINDFEGVSEIENHQQLDSDEIDEDFTHFRKSRNHIKENLILTFNDFFHFLLRFFEVELPPPRF